MNNISIIVAMGSEADSIIKSLALRRLSQPFRSGIPFEAYTGKLDSLQLSLLVSGRDPKNNVDNVATVPATLMTYLAIDTFKPDLVINIGTAGGISSKGCRIGEVYLSSGRFCFHDRRIPLPGFDRYGIGSYPSYDTESLAAALKLKRGVVSTGNSLDLVEKDLELIQANQAIIKDMEAAAIAWVCKTLSVPMMAVKGITDLIDENTPTETQFMDNLRLTVTNLQQKTVEILQYFQND